MIISSLLVDASDLFEVQRNNSDVWKTLFVVTLAICIVFLALLISFVTKCEKNGLTGE